MLGHNTKCVGMSIILRRLQYFILSMKGNGKNVGNFDCVFMCIKFDKKIDVS